MNIIKSRKKNSAVGGGTTIVPGSSRLFYPLPGILLFKINQNFLEGRTPPYYHTEKSFATVSEFDKFIISLHVHRTGLIEDYYSAAIIGRRIEVHITLCWQSLRCSRAWHT